ncbi:MAG: SMP-30/gluconolactonase/LRE family protein [Alphaproteobacteria bacterium]|nr:SMP-30/gluconolactonase/LRE family protein [Alphaproteobacteria bacterium]
MIKVERVAAVANELGECPIWDERSGRLLWVDILGRMLHHLDPSSGRESHVATARAVGSFALTETGNLLLAAGRGGLSWLDPVSGALRPILDPEPDRPDNRFNDGRCDRAGRFWAGTMCDPRREPEGALYRIGADLSCRRFRDGIIVPNSIAWSPDGTVMYFADTYRRTIWAFDYDQAEGTMRGERVFAVLSEGRGRPDGSAVDADGCLWNAVYGGGRLVRYRPDGRIDREIPLPVSAPTCCAFGDGDLGTLYVTSACQRMSEAERAREPEAGNLLALRPGVSGLQESRFAGLP